MKVFEFYEGWADNTPGADIILRSFEVMRNKNTELDWLERDELFERENRCRVGYDPNSGKPRFLVFNDKDWAWFALKWSSDETD